MRGNNTQQESQCSNCLRRGHTLASCLKDNFYNIPGPEKNNPCPTPTMKLGLGDIIVVWDLKTTGLSVYNQEGVKIGYAILSIVNDRENSQIFECVGVTTTQLTLTKVSVVVKSDGNTRRHIRESGQKRSSTEDCIDDTWEDCGSSQA